MKISYFIILGIIITLSITVNSAYAANVSVLQGTSVPGCETTKECFIPYEVSVPIGGEVVWSNDDSAAHTVTGGSAADGPSGVFDSSLFMAGTTFSHTFEAAGEYPYLCMVHPWMEGIVKVGNPPYSPPKPFEPPEIIITVEMNGPSIFYLDESNQIIRATVEIQNYSPSDGQYFMKVTHLPTGMILKDFEIYPKPFGDELWRAQIAYPILESEIKAGDQTILGEFEIEIRADFSTQIGNATFSIFESMVEQTPEPMTTLAPFVDPNQDPQYYVDRYNNEPEYKEWFHVNFPEYDSIYEAVGLEKPKEIAPFVDPNQDPRYYVDRYYEDIMYKKWFDDNYPQYDSIYEAVGLEEPDPSPEPEIEPVPICGPGTELVNGICQVIKSEDTSTDDTSKTETDDVGEDKQLDISENEKFVNLKNFLPDNTEYHEKFHDKITPEQQYLEVQFTDKANYSYTVSIHQYTDESDKKDMETNFNSARYNLKYVEDFPDLTPKCFEGWYDEHLRKSVCIKDEFYITITSFSKTYTVMKQIINKIDGEFSLPSIINDSQNGGGCLIATATYGSELAPQVQQLRELRDNQLLQTESGSVFMASFNDFYYSFSPIIADYERENPVFKETIKLAITPMISSLSILNHVDMETESEVLGYGISLILLNVGMYVGIPVAIILGFRKQY